MKIYKKIALIAIMWLMGYSSMAQESTSQGTVVDEIVAVVGKNIVKLSDIESSFAQVRLKKGYENAQQTRCEILESILLNKLLLHKGEVDSVEVSEDQIDNQVQYYLKMHEMQYGSREAMRQATGYSYEELKDIYYDMIKERSISQRVEYDLTENVNVTPSEVKNYFDKIPKDSLPFVDEQFEISQIVLKPSISEEERDRVRLELNRLRERILKGEKFEMLATLYSQDPGSAKKGGELGFFGRGEMVSAFEAAAFALKPGEVSPVIESDFGFHIIQLIERRGNTVNARHILMIPKVSSEDLLRTRIILDSLKQEINAGKITFEEAAKQFSTASNKNQGGVLTNSSTGGLKFSKQDCKELFPGISVSNMEVGEVSNAMLTKSDDKKDAYQIIKLTKKYAAHTANLVDDYDNIRNAALQEAKNKKVMEWAERMIKNTYIRIGENFKDCNFKLNWTKK